MVEYVEGDLLKADVDALVNPVNCVGVMGKGLALQFKQAYPQMFVEYNRQCNRGYVAIGNVHVYRRCLLDNPSYIINFPTKRHWRDRSQIGDIFAGLDDLIGQVMLREIRSIAIPPLGCGLGGLDWDEVRPLIEHAAMLMSGVRVLVYPPRG